MKTIKSFLIISILLTSSTFASEVTGTISTGGTTATGTVSTGGSQSASTSVSGVVIVAPSANILSGTFVTAQNISLTANGADSIRYATDSVTPTCSTGTLFSGNILINSTTTLKAISCYSLGKSSTVSTWQYNWKVLGSTQVAPINGAASLSSTNHQVVLTDKNQNINLTVPTGVASPTLDISTFIQNGSGVLPEINITASNVNNFVVKIPSGAVVSSASTTWNGILSAPTVKTVTLPVTSGVDKSVSSAIEIGFPGTKLSFSKAVRILLVGQAAKKIVYTTDNISYTEITNTCSADSQTAGDSLAVDSECKIISNNDMVVWTKHFTTFVTYTETTTAVVSSGGGGGGGGGGYSYVPTTSTTATTTSTTSVTTYSSLPSITTSNISKYIFTREMILGMRGDDIKELQKILVSKGLLLATPNGNYGNQTFLAVKQLQKSFGLAQSGNVKTLTLAKLNSLPSTLGSTIPATTSTTAKFVFVQDLKLGSKGSEVLELQKILVTLGYLKATLNGNFGPATFSALKLWQRDNNLPYSGLFGPKSRAILNSLK